MVATYVYMPFPIKKAYITAQLLYSLYLALVQDPAPERKETLRSGVIGSDNGYYVNYTY